MRITPRLKLALIIISSVLIVGIVGAALIYPVITKSKDLRKQQEQAQTALIETRTQLVNRKKYAEEQGTLEAQLATQKIQVPEEAELSDLLRNIQNLAYKNKHWLFEISNSVPIRTEGEACSTWETRFTLEGSWLNTLDFLKELRDMGRQVRITEVVFDRAVDLRGRVDVAPRVVKHWDPEAYPVRVSLTCEVYFVADETVSEEIELRKEKAESEAKAAELREEMGITENENVVTEGGQ